MESTFLLTEDYECLFVIYQQLDTKLQTLNDYNRQILTVCNVTDIKAEIEDSQRAIEKVMACKRKIDLKLKQKSSGSGDNHSESHSSTSQDPARTSQAKAKLPKLTLPKFRGEFTKWNTFWDSFQSAVHDNPEISKVDKFNYLNSVLKGPAARAIAGLTLTASNYENAVGILQDRFGKTQQIITAHMDELIKIAPCYNNRPTSLRYVFEQISVHTRGLASFGVSPEQYGSLLIPIIMSKLPNEIRLQVAQNLTDEVWKIEELLLTIKKEVEARETSKQVKTTASLLLENRQFPPQALCLPSNTAGKIFPDVFIARNCIILPPVKGFKILFNARKF